MASHRLSTLISRPHRPAKARSVDRTPSVRMVITVFAVLLILFAWLHMILSLEIASTGRQIQLAAEELEEIQRGNNLLRWNIAVTLSSAEMATRALDKNYQQQQPIYLPPPQPSIQP